MGTWTENGGVWTLGGPAGRSPAVADGFTSSSASNQLQLATVTEGVRSMPLCSGDGRSGFEAGIFGANVEVRRASFGVTAGAPVVTGAGDTPAAAPCTVAHGIPAGQPFLLDARWVAGKVEVYINAVLKLRYTPATTDAYTQLRHYGWVADNPGARVLRDNLCSLVAQYSTPGETLIAACDNGISMSIDGSLIQRVRANVFSHGGPVSADFFLGKVYMVGGGKFVEIDPATQAVDPVVPTAGTLPGATAGIPGSTTITIVARFLNCLACVDGRNLYLTAVDDAKDFDTGSPDAGRAVVIPMPQTITALREIANGVLVIGMGDMVWRLIGRPDLDAAVLLRPVEKARGVSGKDAIFPVQDGRALVHAPEGLVLVPQSGNAVELSDMDLQEGLTFDRAQAFGYAVQVLPDYARNHIHVFVSPWGPDLEDVDASLFADIIYSTQIGGFKGSKGGYYTRRLPYRIGPTASCLYRGQPVLGGRDGYIYCFDDTLATDDGVPIESVLSCSLIDEPDLCTDTVLEEMAVLLGSGSSDATLTVYSGKTPEEAFIGADRMPEFSVTLTQEDSGRAITQKAKGRALVVELSASGTRILIERVEVRTSIDMCGSGPGAAVPDAPPAPCAPPGPASGDGGFTPGGGNPAVIVTGASGDNYGGQQQSASSYFIDVQLGTVLGGGLPDVPASGTFDGNGGGVAGF